MCRQVGETFCEGWIRKDVALVWYSTGGVRLEDRGKIIKEMGQYNISPRRDSKPEYPEYEAQVSNKQTWCSVYIVKETDKTRQVLRTKYI